jgi:hypothetical protein
MRILILKLKLRHRVPHPLPSSVPHRQNPDYGPAAALQAIAITQFFVTKIVPPHSKAVPTCSPEAGYGSGYHASKTSITPPVYYMSLRVGLKRVTRQLVFMSQIAR